MTPGTISTSPATTTTLPSIALIEPTPLRPLSKPVDAQLSNPTPTSKKQSQSYRLLYRGALLLDDKHTSFPLEGLCFVAHLPPTTPTSFMNHPLPLSLESMHGRPSLRVTSIIQLSTVHARLDDSADVRLYWHPDAYFANEFFLKVVWQLGGWDENGTSKRCVKVALGDEDSSENEVIIYGQLSTNSAVRFLVTRLLPIPPPNVRRAPRPDDPLPRQPLFASPGRKGTKRLLHASPERDRERLRKKGKILPTGSLVSASARGPFGRSRTMSTIPFGNPPPPIRSLSSFNLGPSSRAGSVSSKSRASSVAMDDDDVFKVPDIIPKRSKTQDALVLGPPAPIPEVVKARPPDAPAPPELTELEMANKTAIKKMTNSVLNSRGVTREHPDFKKLLDWTSRGVSFALRNWTNVKRLEREQIKALVVKHVDMYHDESVPAASTTLPS